VQRPRGRCTGILLVNISAELSAHPHGQLSSPTLPTGEFSVIALQVCSRSIAPDLNVCRFPVCVQERREKRTFWDLACGQRA
jgi:hypothetical protein